MAIENITELNTSRGEISVDGSWIQASIRFSDEEGAALLRSQASAEARIEAYAALTAMAAPLELDEVEKIIGTLDAAFPIVS